MNLLTGFRQFLFRGNIIELAIAFVMGIAFLNVVTSVVTNLLTPVISMIFGEPSLGSLDFEINDSIFRYGSVIDEVITFVAIAAAIYFFVMVPVTMMVERAQRGEQGGEALVKTCPECLSTIPSGARRCAHCTAQVA